MLTLSQNDADVKTIHVLKRAWNQIVKQIKKKNNKMWGDKHDDTD